MPTILAILAIGAAMTTVSPAQAQNYPWCAEYGSSHGGRNCGFSTLQQCKAAISGDNTATCVRNYAAGRRSR